ncbi:group III truncated hemoglobin [Alcanivorax marinus]|uniref:Group III truncated hemoglobin n=1 Tax=Alloalcanivorax marinus TaxID=1177169 RepID=A0A9Q3YMX4_9GAMM|nr:group III truncated hemoglobin [Alloalcanivorax marinus]MCC4308056.1 group III truncated hemoglobin [Alloalcanivorax marinus]
MSAPQRFVPGQAPGPRDSEKPDLDSPERIDRMVRLFYDRVLADPLLAPVFLEVARIDLDTHLPLIAAFWKKLLLNQPGYKRHMMAKHRAVHYQAPLTGAHHERWLALFHANLDEHFDGPQTDRARLLSARVMDNLYRQLSRL